MMTLWCMMRSPLMIGAEMSKNDEFTLKLLTNADVIAISRESFCAHPLRTTPKESIWIAPRQDGRGMYIALFNLSDMPRRICTPQNEANVSFASAKELWSGNTIGTADGLSVMLDPHDAAVFLIGRDGV